MIDGEEKTVYRSTIAINYSPLDKWNLEFMAAIKAYKAR